MRERESFRAVAADTEKMYIDDDICEKFFLCACC